MLNVTIDALRPSCRVEPNLFGHFVEHLGRCVYDGLWVGTDSSIPNTEGFRTDVVDALKAIRPPVIRWPGGNFADDYHWEDGVGPPETRPVRTNRWWGGLETNQLGTHEFIAFCRLVGAEPYLAGNVGSETPRTLRNWEEYCNFDGDSTLAQRRRANGAADPFDVRYWGVGNENWAAGGCMAADEYAAAYRRYATLLLRQEVGGEPLRLIACGPPGDGPAWTRSFFEAFHRPDDVLSVSRMWGYAPHFYTFAGPEEVGATEFTDEQWYSFLSLGAGVEGLILDQRAIMDEFDPERRISLVLDEWGSWHRTERTGPDALWQQSTLRDAVLAAITLDTFVRHADLVAMANVAQLVNVLQALFLTEGDRLLLTPTYHVFDMYKGHQAGARLEVVIEAGEVSVAGATTTGLQAVSGSASVSDGVVTVSLVNPHLHDGVEVGITLEGATVTTVELAQLGADVPQAHNTFDDPERVHPRRARVEPAGSGWSHVLPPRSISVFTASIT